MYILRPGMSSILKYITIFKKPGFLQVRDVRIAHASYAKTFDIMPRNNESILPNKLSSESAGGKFLNDWNIDILHMYMITTVFRKHVTHQL